MSIDSDNLEPALLATQGLEVSLLDPVDARYHVVVSADLALRAGAVVGVMGASGGGKSTLALTLAGLISPSARIRADGWQSKGRDHWKKVAVEYLSGRVFRERIATRSNTFTYYISQHARSSLIPNRTIEWHLRVAAECRNKESGDATKRVDRCELLELLTRYYRGKQDEASKTLGKLPLAMSTGECQRALFAMAMLLEPDVLIADEPFASVDPQTAQVLLADARKYVDRGGALMLVTHQLQSLCQFADVGVGVVVDRGAVVQRGPLVELLEGQQSLAPETSRLFQMAQCRFPASRPIANEQQMDTGTALRVVGLAKQMDGRFLFKNQSFEISTGTRVGIFGYSGGGKTTLARIVAGLAEFEGEVHRFEEPNFGGPLSRHRRQSLWKRLQLTYQDTDMVFDPNEIVGKSVVQCIRRCDTKLRTMDAWQQAAELFRMFGLSAELLHAPPARLSGGERKRTAIARSLALLGFPNGDGTSKMLLLDEPTVGVDVFHQGVIAAALIEAQRQLDLTIVVFSHDHSFLTRFCDRLIGWPIESRIETPGQSLKNTPRQSPK